MTQIHTRGVSIDTLPGETVLDALIRRGLTIPFSCRGGSCRSCLQRCTAGSPGQRAARNLAPELIALGYFLPCICVPETELSFEPPDPAHFWIGALLASRDALPDGGWKCRFEPLTPIACAPGSRLHLRGPGGETGGAVAASDPARDFYLDLVFGADDAFALAVIAALAEGDTIEMQLAPDPGADAPAVTVAADSPTPDADAASAPPAHPEPAAPPADPALWAALGDGALVREVLEDFYTRVYADPLLAPFFHKFTQARLVEKQYSFLKELITGEKVYFGNRPRNSHHWMVISDALFDHREQLMLTVLREHGLTEDLVRRWHAIENHYRGEIVKPAPWPKKVGEFEAPVGGFGEMVMEVGSVCDGCGGEIDAGETVRYHLREGTVFCARCGGGALKAA
ncbi:2Fe-2S iron-sulfur cluster-binding protein [Derxia gummosa]|uniref:2Fe-2S iron-sulfur cluster-binding protein n=1 Tax=Derxia gummosa DSM 723 TaxID=1121388 RepID=A0A8B6X523_9BURK|nr:2Fe-2S iron-sulfur cluster-binding protein [Derxia gummosa]